ncbi:4-(cytidine 5'-diphospho)-2-C-methyl-D-erythritol kinase [Pseudorhizobium endolithicum]|uniref:4-diphosphocytidyl-2-C-methyl-D-erythritol kinase n=1 Tax=Pseudorhizobium endolithicum TaxID=1191678 RepID=A0ABN7JZS9_9HYPH|nr:4-(cytidine 5'-diphospho)-2-C-methyl-D-erythritol kinase [Pseudorhizobium endolithicum]CAD7053105.1 4-(cytidine 5'-diphospho)-2-C-methyl-D-erythritol kinase [Pseudorhizobium endolithicum]
MPAKPASTTSEADAAAGVAELARAKINLALHVVGQRPDGYHLLESLVTFADIGDRLTFMPSDRDRLTISGPFSGSIAPDASNLVARARDGLRHLLTKRGLTASPAAIHLEKNLPVASGIGGGSADAAATLRGLLRLWQAEAFAADDMDALALSLGADVPMCLRERPALARGIGEDLSPLADLPALPLVLGNPLRGVSTPEVFSRLRSKRNPGMEAFGTSDWITLLSRLRNDLEDPARELVPEIGEISALIAAQGARLTRMSGSGATCFGIFASRAEAEQAAAALRTLRPDWYFQAAETVTGSPSSPLSKTPNDVTEG